jgi:2-methylisocitrate lyase-like PEP mutase family enzyme
MTSSPTADEIAARRAEFRRLHASGCFVMPNPWDAGSAVYLRKLGFPALATTSAGMAFAQGLPDSDTAVPLELVLSHTTDLVAATDLPVNCDFQSGYAVAPDEVAANVVSCAATGAAGLSIEDLSSLDGRSDSPLHPLDLAVERIRAARAALDGAAPDVLLTARSECYLAGVDEPFAVARERLVAFAEAGADVLYAPGVRDPDQIGALVEAVAPKPVNLLVPGDVGVSVDDVAALGVRRISVGSALVGAAWGGFDRAARALADQGSFAGFAGALHHPQINALFL